MESREGDVPQPGVESSFTFKFCPSYYLVSLFCICVYYLIKLMGLVQCNFTHIFIHVTVFSLQSINYSPPSVTHILSTSYQLFSHRTSLICTFFLTISNAVTKISPCCLHSTATYLAYFPRLELSQLNVFGLTS